MATMKPVIVVGAGPVGLCLTLALAQATRSTPIVFTAVDEPIHYGLVESLARPGGNITGFTNFAPALGGKLLALLKGMAPRVTRARMSRRCRSQSCVVQFHASAPGTCPSS